MLTDAPTPGELPKFNDRSRLGRKLNRLADAIRRGGLVFSASSGLILSGNTVRAATPRGGRYALAGAAGITAASAEVLGVGTIRLLDRDTTSPGGRTLVDSGVDDTCYNAGGAVLAGHYILVEWVDNAWSVLLDKC